MKTKKKAIVKTYFYLSNIDNRFYYIELIDNQIYSYEIYNQHIISFNRRIKLQSYQYDFLKDNSILIKENVLHCECKDLIKENSIFI